MLGQTGVGAAASALLLIGLSLSAGSQQLGDVDCDGVLSHADIDAVVSAVFGSPQCGDPDSNWDGLTSAADLVAEINHVLVPPAPTPTPTVHVGPEVTFIGLTRADDSLILPSGVTEEGVPVYERPFGVGFRLIVEGGRGTLRQPLGIDTFLHDPRDPSVLPDLQIQANRPLGTGGAPVCDDDPSSFDGVPAVDPPDFSVSQPISDAMNDLGCRFIDGTGNTKGRGGGLEMSDPPCVTDGESGRFFFVDAESKVQFCSAVISPGLRFPEGDTLISARVRAVTGEVSPVANMIVRVERR